MCSRLPLLLCRPCLQKNWLGTFRQLCVCLVWLGFQFIFISHLLLHELLLQSLFNAMHNDFGDLSGGGSWDSFVL